MATSARLDELKKKFDENPRRYFAPLANEYRKLGDLTQAIALCRAHLPNQPGHISGHIVLAQALYEARELGESRQIFEASLDLDPENLIALRYLGDIAREQGEPMQARGWYERVLDADPRNEDIAQLLKELDSSAVATADEEESRVPALEDLPQPPLTGFEAPSVTSATALESTVSGSHPIDPMVADGASETPAWGSAPVTSPADEFVVPADELHDLPDSGEPLSFFEESSTEDVFAVSSEASDDSDPFFGGAEGAASLTASDATSSDVPESVSAPDDDWFAGASASPEHEGIEGLPTTESARFEDSFLPDLSQVTPIDSVAVTEASDPEAAPAYVDEQVDEFTVDASLSSLDDFPVAHVAPSQSSIPTPSFLNALDDDEAPAELSSFPSDLDAAPAEEFVSSSATPSSAPFAVPFDVYASESNDAIESIDASDSVNAVDARSSADAIDASAAIDTSDAGDAIGAIDASDAGDSISATDTRDADVDAFGAEPTIGSWSYDAPASEPVAAISEAHVERDVPTLEVDVTPQFAALSETDSEEFAPDASPSGEFASAEVAPDALVANFDNIERDEFEVEPSVVESVSLPDADFVLEYGEFVPPEADETPFIATTVSVPLAGEDSVYDAPAIASTDLVASDFAASDFGASVFASDDFAAADLGGSDFASADYASTDVGASADDSAEATVESVIEAESVELEAEPAAFEVERVEFEQETAPFEQQDAPIASEQSEPWSSADDVAPVEGLISREVAAVADEEFGNLSESDVDQQESPAFVTETMAELYLQQGFTDEALAIYRELLAQQPDDAILQDRIAAIERGASSTVVDGVAPRDTIDRAGQSIRHFFAHFARRAPRARGVQSDASDGDAQAASESLVGEHEGRTAGAANRDEALTVPDEVAPPATLSQLFASGIVSGADEHAATNLSSAYSTEESAPASRIAERELSLEHLFRDVPARSSGAVTLDEFYQGSSSGGSDPAARDAADGEERGADIEQFTAWLEGLKKK